MSFSPESSVPDAVCEIRETRCVIYRANTRGDLTAGPGLPGIPEEVSNDMPVPEGVKVDHCKFAMRCLDAARTAMAERVDPKAIGEGETALDVAQRALTALAHYESPKGLREQVHAPISAEFRGPANWRSDGQQRYQMGQGNRGY